MDCSTPGLPVHHQLWSLLKLMSTESVMPSNHLILCRPLLLLPSALPSIRVFSNESVLHIRWPKFWSFSISPSSEYSGLISFRMDWFDLFAVQGTLKSSPAPQFKSRDQYMGVLGLKELEEQEVCGQGAALKIQKWGPQNGEVWIAAVSHSDSGPVVYRPRWSRGGCPDLQHGLWCHSG